MDKLTKYANIILISVLVILNLILIGVRRSDRRKQESVLGTSAITMSGIDLLQTITSISGIYEFGLDFDSIYTTELEIVEIERVISGGRVVIYLGKNVCTPCAQRFFDELNILYKSSVPQKIILISEAWNMREIILLKDKYTFPGDLYFKKGKLLKFDYNAEKPVLFVLGADLKPKNVFLFQEGYASILPLYLQLALGDE